MTVKDFPPRSGGLASDPHTLEKYLDRLAQRQNIDDQIELTTPLPGDELGIFSTADNAYRKIKNSNLFKLNIVLGTPVASTSGTAIDFTGIPAGTKRVVINFSGVSTNGVSAIIIQIGDSGGIETSGYLGSATNFPDALSPTTARFTTGFGVVTGSAATVILHGSCVLNLANSSANTWAAMSIMGRSEADASHLGGGVKSTSAVLDRVRITTVGGADTFDAGSINISYS